MQQQSDPSIEDIAERSSIPSVHDKLTNDTEEKKKIKKKRNHKILIANLIDTQYPVIKKVVKGMLKMKVIRDSGSEDWDLFWTDNAVTAEQLGKLRPYQKINHFPGMYTLSRKNYLARNLIKMQRQFPNDYNFFPKTWVLPSELNQLRIFMQNQPNAVVIAKPQASSQGKGIFLSKSFEDFEYGEHYVVQKYLKKPFLIDGLKFDLRVYVLVAGCDPLRVYIYKQGLARFATQSYCTPKKENLNNLYMHLTNYAINKNNSKFQFNSSTTEMNKGHKRSLSSILQKLSELGQDREKVWEKIKQCIVKTIISAQPLLAHQYKSSQPNNYANNMCFEILGFDIILDHTLKPEILEVNYTPSFTTDTPLDFEIKKNLIYDALVLMNLTTKTKTQIISEKKKQMKERTLTGKKFYMNREGRLAQINKIQKFRNMWENEHMGNFERAYPLFVELPSKQEIKSRTQNVKFSDVQQESQNEPQLKSPLKTEFDESKGMEEQASTNLAAKQRQKEIQQLDQKYKAFLEYSVSCYHSNTGANVRRNNKVLPQSSSLSQGLVMVNEQTPENAQQINCSVHNAQALDNVKQSIYNQPIKYTNTENLEKIYKSKFRPMLYKRVNPLKKKEKEEENQKQTPIQTPLLSKFSQAESKEDKKEKEENCKSSPYVSIYTHANKMSFKSKNSNADSNPVQRNKNLTTVKDIIESRKQDHSRHSNKFRTGSSLRKGLSTVYNITFANKKT